MNEHDPMKNDRRRRPPSRRRAEEPGFATSQGSLAVSDCLASQGSVQARRSRKTALRIVRSFRIAAVIATLPGRPEAASR